MKRSPLKRKTPLKAKAPMRKRSRAKRTESRWRSQAYLAKVKAMPCCKCGGKADDPHHIIGIGNLSGMGLKAPDSYVIPVCRRCHDEIHARPELLPRQVKWLRETLAVTAGDNPELLAAMNWCDTVAVESTGADRD